MPCATGLGSSWELGWGLRALACTTLHLLDLSSLSSCYPVATPSSASSTPSLGLHIDALEDRGLSLACLYPAMAQHLGSPCWGPV